MIGGGTLFFVGFLFAFLLSRFFPSSNAPWAPDLLQEIKYIVLAVTVGVVFFLAVLTALEAFFYQLFMRPEVLFFHWIGFGSGRSFLGGLAAGVLSAAAVQALSAISILGVSSLLTGLAAAGPAVAIAVIYLLSVPGIFRTLGLSDVKAGVFELAFNSTVVPTLPSASTGFYPRPDAFTVGDTTNGWQDSLRDLTRGIDSPREMPFFIREAENLRVVAKINVGNSWKPDASSDPQSVPVILAVQRQMKLLRDLHPLTRCEAFIRRSVVFDPRQLNSENDGIIAAILELDEESRNLANNAAKLAADIPQAARSTTSPALQEAVASDRQALEADRKDMVELRRELTTQVVKELEGLYQLIPPYLRRPQQSPGTGDPNPGDCNPEFSITPTLYPKDYSQTTAENYSWSPPYLAIFAAYAYAATQSFPAALRVLDKWIADDPDPHRHGRAALWFRDQAELTFTIIQRGAIPSITSDSAVRRALELAAKDLSADWHVNLDEARDCPASSDKGDPDPDSRVKRRLMTAYASLIAAWLHAVVDTRSPQGDEEITARHRAVAAELINFGKKCLGGEPPHDRDERQAFSLFEGGRTLARWAIDGSRQGLLTSEDADDTRTAARNALWEALYKLRRLEVEEPPQPDEPLLAGVSIYELYRREAEQEILDLDGQIAK